MHYLKIVGKVIVTTAIILIAINWQYFYVQIKYYVDPPVPVSVMEERDPQERGEPNKLLIRSLDIDTPVVYTDKEDEDSFQVALRDGVVHYPKTALPGQPGNVYIFGHSSDFPTAPGNYKTVFALLPKINIGDEIEVTDEEGRIYRYLVSETKVVSPSDTSVLEQDRTKKQLTLQTSYPIGTALRRFLAIAYLKD